MEQAHDQIDGPRQAPTKEGAPDSLVIFLHGYGADGQDLIGLSQIFAPLLPNTAFVSPHAPYPCGMNPMGREWFPLSFRDAQEYWRGVTMAAPSLQAFLEAECKAHHLPMNRVALVGFSQGTMMALHIAMRQNPSLACVVGFSGLLAGPEHLLKDKRATPPILLIHGDRDEVVPVRATHFAAQVLAAQGCDVENHILEGLGHRINEKGLTLAGQFLQQNLHGKGK